MAGETDKLTIEIGANVQGAVSGLGKVRMALDGLSTGLGPILSAWTRIDKAVYLGLSGMNAAVTKFTRSVLAVGGGFEHAPGEVHDLGGGTLLYTGGMQHQAVAFLQRLKA